MCWLSRLLSGSEVSIVYEAKRLAVARRGDNTPIRDAAERRRGLLTR